MKKITHQTLMNNFMGLGLWIDLSGYYWYGRRKQIFEFIQRDGFEINDSLSLELSEKLIL